MKCTRNYILERIQKFISELVRILDFQNNYLDEDDAWSGIISDTDFAVQMTYQTMSQATPGQMVFEFDMNFEYTLYLWLGMYSDI